MTNYKEQMQNNIQYMTEEQIKLICEIINIFAKGYVTKWEILKLSTEDTTGIDSAIPLDYVRRIEEILPQFKTMYHVYDYQVNNYGEMSNVCERLIEKLQSTFKEDTVKRYQRIDAINESNKSNN